MIMWYVKLQLFNAKIFGIATKLFYYKNTVDLVKLIKANIQLTLTYCV